MQIKTFTTIALLSLIVLCPYAMGAETTSTSLPYESWLKTIQKSLTGPVAFSVSLIGIVSCGATLIFTGGELGRFMRSIIYLVMVMTMLVGANTLMSNLFNGALIEDNLVLPEDDNKIINTLRSTSKQKETLLQKRSIMHFQNSALNSLLPRLNEESC